MAPAGSAIGHRRRHVERIHPGRHRDAHPVASALAGPPRSILAPHRRPATPLAAPATTESRVSDPAGSRATTVNPARASPASAPGQGSAGPTGPAAHGRPTPAPIGGRADRTTGVQQYGPGAKGGGVAEDGAHVLVVVDALDHHDRPRRQHRLRIGAGLALGQRQHTTVDGEPGDAVKDGPAGHIAPDAPAHRGRSTASVERRRTRPGRSKQRLGPATTTRGASGRREAPSTTNTP